MRLRALVLIALLVLGFVITAVWAQGGMRGDADMQMPTREITITINGEMQRFDAEPMMLGGRVMVPMRGIFEALGAQVQWDAQQRTVTARRGEQVILLTLDSTMATVNGTGMPLDVAPQMHQDRIYVPTRFVSEALGAQVQWNADAHQVAITTAEQPRVALNVPTEPTEPMQPAEEDVQQIAQQTAAEDDAVIKRGKEVYAAKNCDACHRIAGEGGTSASDLSHVGLKLTPTQIRDIIVKGTKGMPAYKLPEKDLEALVAYMVSLK